MRCGGAGEQAATGPGLLLLVRHVWKGRGVAAGRRRSARARVPQALALSSSPSLGESPIRRSRRARAFSSAVFELRAAYVFPAAALSIFFVMLTPTHKVVDATSELGSESQRASRELATYLRWALSPLPAPRRVPAPAPAPPPPAPRPRAHLP